MIHAEIFFIFIFRPQAQAQTLLDYRHSIKRTENQWFEVQQAEKLLDSRWCTGDTLSDVYNAQAQSI